ncbi:unnamed protein product [Hymenolepis diminuta]|uniref:Macrophage-expressed gene 1 protein n=1 Tax=Hymenolepis diminuta TaxID=6216 RepID=A0A158QEK0_HYMDI|nr:unnamed protein product [Hymenolepis diminuta]
MATNIEIIYEPGGQVIPCASRPYKKLLSVLPGSGWDNLVNEERGLTTNREIYSLCRLSPDDNYVIPNDVIIEPLKSSQIELSSQAFSHFTNYTSLTALSVNTGGDIGFHRVSIGGDFSFEKEMVRRAENINKGLTMRSQLRHRWFIVHQLPDSQLHPRFRNRLLDIAAHLERSNISTSYSDITMEIVPQKGRILSNFGKEEMLKIMDGLRAAYLADLIVRDFGTHTITAVEAGAVVAKIDSLVGITRMLEDSDKTKLEYGARASFFDLFKINNSAEFNQDKKYTDDYYSNVASSFILSFGGPSLKASDMNLTTWESGVVENLVAIDRRGRPIYDLITPRALPELSESLTFALAATVRAAVERYYEANSVVGCLDPTSPAYDSDANVASDRCDNMDFLDPFVNNESGQTPFGGVYTACEGPADLCSRHATPNLATGSTSCPEGFKAINLLPPQVRSCAMKCEPVGIFHKPVCVHECAVTRAYWCALDPSYTPYQLKIRNTTMELGFLFGGIYTDTLVNPITNAQSCPPYYENQLIGRRIQVCLSTDREFGRRYSMAFGGFYACQSGNPLYDVLSLNKSSQSARHLLLGGRNSGLGDGILGDDQTLIWPKQCPNGYTSHMAGIEDTCLVNYCVPANSLKVVKDRLLKRPPFIQLPEFSNYDLKKDVEKALNEPLHLVDTFSGRSYHNEDGNWVKDTDDSDVTNIPTMMAFAVIGISFCVCVGVLLIIGAALLIFKIRNIYRRSSANRQLTTTEEEHA